MLNQSRKLLTFLIRNRRISRLSRRIAVWFLRNELQPYLLKYAIGDTRFFVNPKYFHDATLLKTDCWEPAVSQALYDQLKVFPSGIFWDVGAASGFHSVSIKKMLHNIEIYSFEPSWVMLKYLYENIRINNVDIQILPIALDEKTCLSQLNFVTSSNPGLSSLVDREGVPSVKERILSYRADHLQEYLRIPAPSVIKIDTEGTTLRVLKGMGGILKGSSSPVIVMECFDNEKEETFSYLQSMGYDNFVSLDNEKNYLVKKSSK